MKFLLKFLVWRSYMKDFGIFFKEKKKFVHDLTLKVVAWKFFNPFSRRSFSIKEDFIELWHHPKKTMCCQYVFLNHPFLVVIVHPFSSSENLQGAAHMPMIENSLASNYTPPPDTVLLRCREAEHLFAEAVRIMADDTSDIWKNNRISNLMSRNFVSHPAIHRGYYDEKYGGILYVYDALDNNNKIRKDEAVLLSNGTFTKSNNSKLFRTFDSTVRQYVLLAKIFGDRGATEWLTSKWFWSQRLDTFVPYNPLHFHLHISEADYADFLCTMYRNFCGNTSRPVAPEFSSAQEEVLSPEFYGEFFDFIQDVYENNRQSFLSDYIRLSFKVTGEELNAPNTFHDFGPDAPAFGEVSLLVSSTESLRWMDTAPVLTLNHSSGGRYITTYTAARNPGIMINESPEQGLPFYLYIEYNMENVASADRPSMPSANNDGRLLSYTTRVDTIKSCFKMTESETLLYGEKLKDLEKKKKEWAKLYDKTYRLFYRESPVSSQGLENRIVDQIGPEPKVAADELPIFLGLELEVVCRGEHRSQDGHRNVIKAIADSKFGDHCIMKSDGSIGEWGLEIVTVPATLDYHRRMFIDHFFNEENAFHKRIMSTDRCGIHVHISKDCFTPLSLGNFMNFINSTSNWAFMNDMAGREPNEYCRKIALKRGSKGVDLGATSALRACKGGLAKGGLVYKRLESVNRREAVNIQNARTIEVRMFKSTNDKNNLLRKLEFCDSAVRFARSCNNINAMTVYDYVNFILDHSRKGDYPHLVRWLAAKEYIGHSSKIEVVYVDGKPTEKKRLRHIYGENLVPIPDTEYHKKLKIANEKKGK